MSEPELWNEIGNIYYNTGAYDKAISTYKKVIALNPACGQSYRNLALIFVMQGRYTEAIPMFQKGIELFDKPIDKAYLWNQMGDAYRKLEDHLNASIAYRKAIELDPDDSTLQENLAEVVQASRIFLSKAPTDNSQQNLPSSNPDIAEVSVPGIESFDKIEPTQLKPRYKDDNEMTPEVLSVLPDATGRAKPGDAFWVFKDNKPDQQIEENTTDTSQSTPMVLGSRILSDAEIKDDVVSNPASLKEVEIPDWVARQGSDDISIPDAKTTHSLNHADGPSPINQPEAQESTNATAHCLLGLGIRHWRKGEFERAIKFLKAAIEAADKSQEHFLEALGYNAIALVDTDLGKIEDAIQAYQSAANLAPERIFPWNNLGNLNCKLDRYDDARAAFQEAIEHDPKDPVSWNGLGDVYHRLGRNEDAIAAYQLGNVFEKQNLDEDALKEFEGIIASEQEQPQVWNEAGNIYFDSGAYDDAIASYSKAIELDPTNATYQAGLVKAERALEAANAESEPAPAGTLIEIKPKAFPQPEYQGVEKTSSQYEKTDAAYPDSTGAEQAQITGITPESKPSRSDTDANYEPAAAYWMFNNAGAQASTKQPTTPSTPAIAGTVLSTIKPIPAFPLKTQYKQVFSGDQVLTDSAHNHASLLVQLPPRADKPVRKEEIISVPDAKDNRESAIVDVDIEWPKSCSGSTEILTNDDAPLSSASGNQAAGQPSLDHQTLDNDIAAYQRVIELNPKNDRAWDTLGNMYESVGLHDEAVSAFEQAIALVPQREVYHFHLGIALAYQMKYDKAIQALQRVVELDPNYMLAHCALAGCYRRFGKEVEAQEHIKIARPSMENENEYNQACFESISGNVDRAFTLLEIALKKQQIQLAVVRNDPDLDFIRHDPRFEMLLYRTSTISQ